jgi:SAM-dependent methyltransferase
MAVDYNHNLNLHTLEGAHHALKAFLPRLSVSSVLDIGCGRGTWLKAALDCGIQDVVGVDGVALPRAELHFPPANFLVRDLSQPIDLGRKFDLVVCLEVGEHLESAKAPQLVANLTRHADTVLFSAACPGQLGQHHINCQWPDYWQSRFNKLGFVCSDWPRWTIWSNGNIEPWYRQNMFIAERNDREAGKEGRICPVVHPEVLHDMQKFAIRQARNAVLSKISQGEMSLGWHLKMPVQGLWHKALRKLSIGSRQP